MLKIHLNTGTAWTKSIIVEGHLHSDLLQLVDDYYSENGSLPVPMYSMEDLEERYYGDPSGLEYALDEMLPINGGEYYIEGINWVEEI